MAFTTQIFIFFYFPLCMILYYLSLFLQSTKNMGGVLQHNILIDGENSREEGGKFIGEVRKHFFWFHTPELYSCYDTYAKMQRYKTEWQGKTRAPSALSPGLYQSEQQRLILGGDGKQSRKGC